MIAVINGSPKTQGGASGKMTARIQETLGGAVLSVFAAKGGAEAYEQLAACEAAVLVFPIYVDALPSHLLRFLMGWEEYRKGHGGGECKVYAVTHAGFYDAVQCRWSLDIIRNFCTRAGLCWCGGAGLGGGVLLAEMAGSGPVKPLEKAVDDVALAAKGGEVLAENRFVSVGMPRWMYKAAGNMGWKNGAKQNGLKPKELLRVE